MPESRFQPTSSEIFYHEDVLRFLVPVCSTMFMDNLKTCQQLIGDLLHLGLRKRSTNIAPQVSTREVLYRQEDTVE